jgi:hypothetical protein
MKPQREFRFPSRATRYEGAALARSSPVNVECEFHSGGFRDYFGGQGSPGRRPGFNSLAKEALRANGSRTFRVEAAVLGLLAMLAAWPMAMMIHEVIHFCLER